MLYKAIKRTIESGKGLDTLQDKLDIFLLRGRITQDEYDELSNLLAEKLKAKDA